jgi:hypothetical protein
VFPGDFDLDAAIAVIEPVAEVDGDRASDGLTLVSRLVDKSLVIVVGSGDDVRYRLLDPIRQYAAEKLADAGETDAQRSRHRDVLLARYETLWPLMTAQQRRRAYADRESLIAALEWAWLEGDAAAALRLVVIQTVSWMCVGDAQGREWLERVLATPTLAVHPARARALNGLALSLNDSGAHHRERIEQLMAAATAVAEQVGDAEELAACRLSQAEIMLGRGRAGEARPLIEAALATYEGLGAAGGVAWCHFFMGWVAVAEDDSRAARRSFERALQMARSTLGAEWLLPHTLAGLAPIVARLGESSYASQLADEAVSSARPFAGRAVLAMALARAAEAAILSGDRDAAAFLDELLNLLHDLGTRRWAADALEMVTVVLERRGQHGNAVVALGAAEGLRQAAAERGGGVRAVADEVCCSIGRLRQTLSREPFVAHEERGRSLSPEAAIAAMVVALRATDVT